MAKAPRVIDPQLGQPAEFGGDDLTEEEIEQASVGDLISIQGPEFENVSWSIWRHRTRQEMALEHSAEPEEWVGDRTGQLHGSDLVEAIGGGTFHMRGYVPRSDGRGVRLKYNRTIALAGPRKNFAAVATVPVAQPAALTPVSTLSRAERLLLKAITKMDERLAKLEQTPAQPAAAPPSLKDMAETMVMLQSITRGEPTKNPDVEVVKTYVGMIQQGIELGQGREPAPAGENGGTDWGKIAETGMTLLDRVLTRQAATRMARSRPAGAPPSSATVVDPPAVAEAPATPPPPAISHRWLTAMESMATAIAEGDEPADFASDLARILNTQEIGLLKLASADDVMERCKPYLEALPILGTDQARAFIDGVLNELRNPSEDGSDL